MTEGRETLPPCTLRCAGAAAPAHSQGASPLHPRDSGYNKERCDSQSRAVLFIFGKGIDGYIEVRYNMYIAVRYIAVR